MNYKLLKSGISVNDEAYYKLLEWKDQNMQEYIAFCDKHSLPYSINAMNTEQYNKVMQNAFPVDKPNSNS